jgi:FkbM family methyltransferase
MRIFYGTENDSIDVTDICLTKLVDNKNIITIPSGDIERSKYFTDPLFGTLKKIFIIDEDENKKSYDDSFVIKINTITNNITTINNYDINKKTRSIQSKLKIKYGSFFEELPEQKMVVKYLTGNEKVLEIGGNIGRNSLIIASILNNNKNNNLVTLECDTNIAMQLVENRFLNKLNFYIENSALSKRKLIQKGWDTIPSDVLQSGYKWVKTISIDELKSKYNIQFDTLVIDCEGALYYILMDMPEILNNIKLIIMENDYHNISHKNYIDQILINNKFYRDYVEKGGWGPCYNNFFEVWKKLDI